MVTIYDIIRETTEQLLIMNHVHNGIQIGPACQVYYLDNRATVTFVREIQCFPDIISQKALKNKEEIDFRGVHLYPGTSPEMLYILGFSGLPLFMRFSHNRSRSGEHIVHIEKRSLIPQASFLVEHSGFEPLTSTMRM